MFGGNLDLQPETAKTWTLGVVFQPEFLPRFSMSLDYYNIRIKDVIGSALPGDVIRPASATIRPARLRVPHRIRTAWSSVVTRPPAASTATRRRPRACSWPTTNLGELFTDGVDLIMNYRTDVGFGDLAWSFVGNWTKNSEFNANAATPDSFFRECAGYYSVNCSFTGSIQPKLQFSQRCDPDHGQGRLLAAVALDREVKFEPRQIEADARGCGQPCETSCCRCDQGCPDFCADPDGCMIDESSARSRRSTTSTCRPGSTRPTT